MKKKCNNSNSEIVSRIIRDGGGVTSDRHLTGWVRFAHTAPYRKCGFTLAEVLITLAIVGVVAAITMPALIANIQDRVKTARIQNITQKFGKATDKMKSLSTLGGYATTMDFVNELQKHLKIAKVCDNQHLTECWPTEKVIINDEGKEWEISKTTTGKQLKMTNDDTHEYGDTVGIVTADGTAMILAYNAKCDIDEVPVTWSNNQSSTSGCVAAVFDWNGSKMPNKLSNDVVTFNAGGLGQSCAVEIDGACFGASFVPTPVTKAECEQLKADGYGIQACGCYDNDYWAGAVKQCGGTDKMPKSADLVKLASLLYEGNRKIKPTSVTEFLTYNGQASSLGLPEPPIYLWSDEENGACSAYYRSFTSSFTQWSAYNGRDNSFRAMCLLD